MRDAVLRVLSRAMATQSVARHFVAECSDELSAIPEAASLVATITRLSAALPNGKVPVIGVAEKSAGVALFGLIRDKWGETLKATTPLPTGKVPVTVPRLAEGLVVKRIAPMGEYGKQVGEGIVKKGGKVKVQTKGANPNGSEPADHAERVRQVIALPPVKVTVVPTLQRAAARHAFFAQSNRVEYRQSGIIADPDPVATRIIMRPGLPTFFAETVSRKGPKGDDLKAADFPNMGAAKKVGIDPRVVLATHRDIIGSNPEGLRVLTVYEHHAIGPYAALDMVRRILHAEHIGHPKVTIQLWISHDPPGVPTPELREARRAAEVEAKGAVMTRDASGKPVWYAYAESQPPTLYPVKDPRRAKSEA